MPDTNEKPPAARDGPWAALASPRALPDDPSAAQGVEWIQTHLSHVYRTARRVYKFRKPVDLGFVRFAERAERNADCLREVALNRRLAPDVYLGVAPLVGDATRPVVGPCAESLSAEDVEHCVVMRRLPDGRDALSLLEAGALTPDHLEALARRLAGFHEGVGLGAPAPFEPDAWRRHCTRPVAENFEILARADPSVVAPEAVARAHARAEEASEAHADRFEHRRRDGRAVDAHGDLHLQHVWYEGPAWEPIAIDCLEFSGDLRRIDTASEVAFPAMDLRYRGASSLAEHFLRVYARERDDFDLYGLVDYFVAYRAAVRAKVAALAARDPGIGRAQREGAVQSARAHLALATEALAPAPPGVLVLVCGIVGSGKSSVAGALAERADAVVIASDRVRKQTLGIAPDARLTAAWGRGAYTDDRIDHTYDGLIERAAPVLASGRIAILDATWSRARHRTRALEAARRAGTEALLVEVRCDREVARGRLARRAREGRDPSDAGPDALAPSAAAFEPTDAWPTRHFAVDTSRSGWRDTLGDAIALLRARRG